MEKKYYRPILKEGNHLVRSSKNPARVRGQSRDANNKNPDIVEWEEIDIEKLQEMVYHEKLVTQDGDFSRINDLDFFLELFDKLSCILSVVLEKHPEYAVAIVECVRHIKQNVSKGKIKIVKGVKSIINREQTTNAKRIIREHETYKKQTDVTVKRMTPSIVEADVLSENQEAEDMSVEEARKLVLNILLSYINMKKDFARLSKAHIKESDLLQIDIKQVRACIDNEMDKFPALMDEKTSRTINDILNEYFDKCSGNENL